MAERSFTYGLRHMLGFVFLAALLSGAVYWSIEWARGPRYLVFPDDPPIVRAAAHGELDEVKRLLEQDPSRMFDEDRHGGFAIHRAIFNGQNHVARFLVQQGYPLHWPEKPVIFHALGHTKTNQEMLRYLLECGADPNQFWSQDRLDTPMHLAVHNLQFGNVRILWEYGGRLDLENEMGQTAAELANRNAQRLSDPSVRFPHGERVSQESLDRLWKMVELIEELSARERIAVRPAPAQ